MLIHRNQDQGEAYPWPDGQAGHGLRADVRPFQNLPAPWLKGQEKHESCRHKWDDHGWLIREGDIGSLVVCPGNWLVKIGDLDWTPHSPSMFETLYGATAPETPQEALEAAPWPRAIEAGPDAPAEPIDPHTPNLPQPDEPDVETEVIVAEPDDVLDAQPTGEGEDLSRVGLSARATDVLLGRIGYTQRGRGS